MADDRFFAAVKPGAILINTSRGEVVDLDALTRALRSERLRAAGLDVLPVEPPDRSHPLIAAWAAGEAWVRHRLVLTPHCAFWCDEAYRDMRHKAATTARAVLEGGRPRNCVSEPACHELTNAHVVPT
jgi:phosphoglycerate dehydrogenase-like enzyme